MSLIQEALKRQQEDGTESSETNDIQPAPPLTEAASAEDLSAVEAPPVSAPPPLPEADAPSLAPKPEEPAAPPPVAPEIIVEGSKAKPLKSLIGILLIVILLIGGVAYGIIFALRQFKGKDTEEPDQPEKVTETNETKPEAVNETEPIEDIEEIADIEPTEQPVETVEVVEETVEEEPEPAPVVESWPIVSLTGIVGRGETGSAVLNGEITSVGDSVDDVKLVFIYKDRVKLEFNGKSQIVKMGHSTE